MRGSIASARCSRLAVSPALSQGFAFTSDLAGVYITSTATNTLAVVTTARVLPGVSEL